MVTNSWKRAALRSTLFVGIFNGSLSSVAEWNRVVDDEEWFNCLHSSSPGPSARSDSCALNLPLAESSPDAICFAFPQTLGQNDKASSSLPENENRKQRLVSSSMKRVMKKPSLIARKTKTEPKKTAVSRRLRIKGRFLKKETELLLREFAYIA